MYDSLTTRDLLETRPIQWQDKYLWPVLLRIWTPLTGGKISYGWHWIKSPVQSDYSDVLEILNLDLEAHERTNLWHRFWQTNFGWKKVVILQPENPNIKEYRVGFYTSVLYPTDFWFCTIVVRGKCKLLIGPGPVYFFGVSLSSSTVIKLKIYAETTRDDPTATHIPLL